MNHYTAPSQMIIKTLERVGEPLTEEQETILCGIMVGLIISIKANGLEKAIADISARPELSEY